MSLLLSIYYYQLFALPSATVGAPVGSIATQLSSAGGDRAILKTELAPSWASSATYRGTSDILWSCLIALLACIYTAIHLNVPPAHLGRLRSLWRKLQWVGVALFAPELVLYTAYSQYVEARDLIKELNTIRLGGDCERMKLDTAGKWLRRARKSFYSRKKRDKVTSCA